MSSSQKSSLSLPLVCRYGPFWVATTLVFVSAVTGNYASYISYKHSHSGSQTAVDSWYYNVDKVCPPVPYPSLLCFST